MRAAIYARVSSAAQRERHTIENQLPVLREYVRSQGWTLAGEYVDDGRSAKAGKLEAREGYRELVRDAEAGKFDVLVVIEVDRLTRTDDPEERARIITPFRKRGIDIVTPSGGRQDLRTLIGEMTFTMKALFAAEENRLRAERIKAGKLRAIAEGRKPAGPTPYGHAYDRDAGEWSLNVPRAEVLREIFGRVIAGESCLAIADDLHARAMPPPRGPWTRHKVWDLVRSRHAVGEWTADKGRRLVIRIPPIVDEATWQAAQAKLIEHGKRGLVKTKHVHLLQGIAKCALCGSPIAIRSATTNRNRANGNPSPAAYVCRARKLERRGEVRCPAKVVKVADADARMWAKISAALEGPELAAQVREIAEARAANHHDWREDAKKYRAHIARLVKAEAGILSRFARGTISGEALDIALAAMRRERDAIEAQLRTAEDGAAEAAGEPQAAPDEWLAALRDLARSSSPDERQRVVRMIAKPGSVVLDRGLVRLTLRIGVPDSRALRVAGGLARTTVLAVVPDCRNNHGKIGAGVLKLQLVA